MTFFDFANWQFLFLLLIIPVIIFWYLRGGKKHEPTFRYSSIKSLQEIAGPGAKWKNMAMVGLKILGLILLILALARPQKGNTVKEFTTKGIDIVLVLDISSSMRALDFKPNRLEAAKTVAEEFIEGRHNDRIGLVVFGAESFLQCPLTIDYNVLKNFLRQVDIIEKEFDGTAIGMAIANGINRLRDSKAKSKVIILLSDGRNNAGELDPETAADMAKAYGIKIYTIGAAKRGPALYPVKSLGGRMTTQKFNVEIDEEVLENAALLTGGKYFRATDNKSLVSIYKEISKMEKTEINVKEYYNFEDLYHLYLLSGFFLILLSMLLGFTIWRKTP